MVVDAELVEVVGGGDLEHEGGGRGRLRVSRDPGMLQTLRHAGPVAENKKNIGDNFYFEKRREMKTLSRCVLGVTV